MRNYFDQFKRWLVCFILSSISVIAHANDEINDSWNGFSLGGYGVAKANLHPSGNKDASLQDISAIIRWEGDSPWRFFSEIELEKPVSWQAGSGFSITESRLSLERLYLDYNLTEAINLRLGRFLNPIGRWNLIHADPLVWTTTRPLATIRLFPQSTNGLMLFGSKSIDSHAIEYSVYAEALKNDDQDRNLGEAENTKGIHLALAGAKNFGISIMEFTEHTPTDKTYRLLGLDFQTKVSDWELSAEAYQRYTTHGSNGGNGGYIQAVAPIANNLYAVSRIDAMQIPQAGNTSRWLIGTAWKQTPNQVFKIEYVGGNKETPESPKGLITSFSILF